MVIPTYIGTLRISTANANTQWSLLTRHRTSTSPSLCSQLITQPYVGAISFSAYSRCGINSSLYKKEINITTNKRLEVPKQQICSCRTYCQSRQPISMHGGGSILAIDADDISSPATSGRDLPDDLSFLVWYRLVQVRISWIRASSLSDERYQVWKSALRFTRPI